MAFVHVPVITNAAELAAEVVLGQTVESIVLDFKRDYHDRTSSDPAKKAKARWEACKDVAALANTYGGLLVVGVDEAASGSGPKTATAFVGLTDPTAFKQWVLESLRSGLSPGLSPIVSEITAPTGASVVVIDVRAHRGLVSLRVLEAKYKDKWTVQHPQRTSYGNHWMSPDDAIGLAIDRGRALRCKIMRLAPGKCDVDIRSRVVGQPHQIWLDGHDEDTIKLTIHPMRQNAISIAVPYGLITEVWRIGEDSLGLFLSVDLHVSSNGVALGRPGEPTQ